MGEQSLLHAITVLIYCAHASLTGVFNYQTSSHPISSTTAAVSNSTVFMSSKEYLCMTVDTMQGIYSL